MSSQFEAIEISSGEFKETVHVPIKNLKGILAPKNDIFSSNKDPEKLIINAIEEPIASKPLELLLNKDSKVSIVVDDATRQTPTQLILKILLKKLEKIGINPENVVIQIANGLHRLTTLEEKKKILGEDVLEKFEVFDNDAKKDEYQFLAKLPEEHLCTLIKE